jgi:hypothetical protein
MDMVAMAVPGPNLFHPFLILWLLNPTEFFLNHRANEDAFYIPILSGELDERRIRAFPSGRVQMNAIRHNHTRHRCGVRLLRAKRLRWHGAEPNVHV